MPFLRPAEVSRPLGEVALAAGELQKLAEESAEQYKDSEQIFIRRWGSGNTADALEKQYSTTLQQLASAVQAADTELQRCKLQATEAETSFAQLKKQLPEISDTLQHCKDNFTTLLTAHHFADKADYMAAETLVPKLPLLREKQRRLTEEAGTTAAVARSGESELEGMLAESPQQKLRSAGKMIGIISHVPALSEQIPARIQVTPRRGGFSTLSGSAAVQSSR